MDSAGPKSVGVQIGLAFRVLDDPRVDLGLPGELMVEAWLSGEPTVEAWLPAEPEVEAWPLPEAGQGRG